MKKEFGLMCYFIIPTRLKVSISGGTRCIALLFSVLYSVVVQAELTDTSYYHDLQERLQISQDVEPLDQSLAGESIDYFSGGLSFSVTDISIPGNFAIPVQISRTLTQSTEVFSQFGDWEMNLPRITGRLPNESYLDCQNPIPPKVPDGTFGVLIAPEFYHKGLTLHDGNGYSGTLLHQNASEAAPFTLPVGYKFHTKENWIVKCSGTNFVAVSPSGITYTFDKLESEPVNHEVCISSPQYEGLCLSTRTTASRVSKIQDRFGNIVTYHYDTLDRLVRISASDDREVTLHYNQSTARIDRVSANGRDWNYIYHYSPSKDEYILTGVERPDGSAWEYSLYDEGCNGPCATNPVYSAVSYRHLKPASNYDTGPTAKPYYLSVVHPEGAKVEYEFKGIFLHRFDQNLRRTLNPQTPSNQSCSTIQCKGRTPSVAIKQKRLYHTDSDYYEWNFSYSDDNKDAPIYDETGGPINDAVTRQTTTITGPTDITDIVYHRRFDWKEGKELWRVVKDLNGVELSRTTNSWQKGDHQGPLLFRGGWIRNDAKEEFEQRLVSVTTQLEGSDYFQQFSDFNDFGTATKTHEFNDYSNRQRYTFQGYQHDTSHWLINQPTTTAISGSDGNYTTVAQTTYYAATDTQKSLPFEQKLHGSWIKRYVDYHADGNPKRIEYNAKLRRGDGTMSSQYRFKQLENYKRGKPQSLIYPARYNDLATINESQTVDDNGWVTAISDLNGNASSYQYDSIGRLATIDLAGAWADTRFEWGLASGGTKTRTVQRCTVIAGSCAGAPAYTETTTYDHMLRPLVTAKTDVLSATSRYQNRSFDAVNQTVFESYWSSSPTESDGTHMAYDGLSRLRSNSQTGGGTHLTDYLSQNRIKTTNTRGFSTTTEYLAYGAPEYQSITAIASPEGVSTLHSINLFGDITAVTQTGPGKGGVGTVTQTEHRAYDSNHQLCKVVRNDVGQTAYAHTVLGERIWMAEGVTGGGNNDCGSGATEQEKSYVQYDNLGGVQALNYPDASPDVTYQRDNMGNLSTLTAGNIQQTYHYNSLNLPTAESLSVDGEVYTLGYGYNNLGHLSSLTYPDTLQVDYAPNGFGEPTKVSRAGQPYASNVTYYPNGVIDSFTFGNGITHKTTLNQRRFPSAIQDSSADVTAMQLSYSYDGEGNVTQRIDGRDNNFSLINLNYDGLDRLISTTGNSGIGSSAISFDGLGNITTYTNGAKSLDYHYDLTSNRLASVSGSRAYGFQYDSRGNVTHNGRRALSFNRANQLAGSEGNLYDYDGHNRRVKIQDSKGTSYTLYSLSGKLLYRELENKAHNYIYLGNKLIAKDGIIDASENSRQHYRPFGETVEPAKDEVGYTGHKFDTDLGLSYMQARYYDPEIGRFYSNDPIGYRDLHSFGRYSYANNNPYRYIDPDGRSTSCTGSKITNSDGSCRSTGGTSTNMLSGGARRGAQKETWGFKNNADGGLILCIGSSACSASSNIQNASTSQIVLEGIGMIPWGKATKFLPGSRAAAEALKTQLTSKMIASGHAFEKHILHQGQFSFIRTRAQFASHIESVMTNPTHFKQLGGGRAAYFDQRTSTIVFTNPGDADGGTAFQTTLKYFNDQN